MGLKTTHITVGIAVFAIAGLFPSIANAGYILSSDASSGTVFSADSGAGATPSSERSRSDEIDRLLTRLFDITFDQVPAGTGTNAPPAPSSGGVSAVASPIVELSAGAQLVQRLGLSGKVWLPPPFLSGVFRPPRFAG